MKKYDIGIAVWALICLASLPTAVAAPRSQDESSKSKSPDAAKAEEKKAAKPQPAITVHIKVSAEGLDPLPNQSSVQMRGLDDCDTLDRRGNLDPDGQITFSELPVCKVALKILITGFETKALAEVILADHKNATMRIQVNVAGPPILN
jgi:hypothetical protein